MAGDVHRGWQTDCDADVTGTRCQCTVISCGVSLRVYQQVKESQVLPNRQVTVTSPADARGSRSDTVRFGQSTYNRYKRAHVAFFKNMNLYVAAVMFQPPLSVQAVRAANTRANVNFSDNIPKEAAHILLWDHEKTELFVIKQRAQDGYEGTPSPPGAGVLKKTVRSAKPPRLNININMLVRALALADSIKFLLCLCSKPKIW